MSDFKIDRDISLPNSRAKYSFEKMDVGDSVFFEGQNSGGNGPVAARMFGSKAGRKFASRMVDGGVRVWRIG